MEAACAGKRQNNRIVLYGVIGIGGQFLKDMAEKPNAPGMEFSAVYEVKCSFSFFAPGVGLNKNHTYHMLHAQKVSRSVVLDPHAAKRLPAAKRTSKAFASRQEPIFLTGKARA